MGELFQMLEYWHWLLLGVVFLTLEIFAPGVFFMWMGVAAGIVGAALWLLPGMGWETQVLAFALLSIVSVVIGRKWLERHPIESEQPSLNRRGEQYVGRVFTLQEPIVNGQGKIKVDDSTWKIQGPECEAGRNVKVTGVDGVVLIVECE